MASVLFRVGEITVQAELDDTPTGKSILEALPIESSGDYWGGEFYFPVPVSAKADRTAREVVEPGTVAFWVQGSCLCLFWGATPASTGDECRAASAVNVVGRVSNVEALPKLKARKVRVEAA